MVAVVTPVWPDRTTRFALGGRLRLCVESKQAYDRKSKLGLVINFWERFLKTGIHRVVNGLPENLEFNAKPQRRSAAKPKGNGVRPSSGAAAWDRRGASLP